MTKKLEEVFNLPPMKEVTTTEEKRLPTKEEALERSASILKSLSTSEKIDHALTTVAGLTEHDEDMDEIYKEAIESYLELKELGMNMSDVHAGRMMEVAANMLKTAMEAKDAKVNRKLKTIELQLKRLKLSQDNKNRSDPSGEDYGNEFDRNELLRHILNHKPK